MEDTLAARSSEDLGRLAGLFGRLVDDFVRHAEIEIHDRPAALPPGREADHGR
ncbi:hypothetical protein ACIPIU_18895 [Streptomyces massasporeus]|uniref:hypothetical protein n=1 Tax=Streptomyces massasporeus TaxID=67324 RepID=UPI0036E10D91